MLSTLGDGGCEGGGGSVDCGTQQEQSIGRQSLWSVRAPVPLLALLLLRHIYGQLQKTARHACVQAVRAGS